MSVRAHMHLVVLAGGSGTRFWPLSRRRRPKQLLDLTGEGTLLQATFARVASLCPPERSWMVVGAHHADGCSRAAPQVAADRLLQEPCGRNTAPAIALGAFHVHRRDPDAVMVVLPADHHVRDAAAFCEALELAARLALDVPVVTLGIRPTHPETGYGYIERGSPHPRCPDAFAVRRFCEKPSESVAREFLAQGGFDWNAGIFVMRPRAYLDEVARQLPAVYERLVRVDQAVGKPVYESVLADAYAGMASVSIDYGIMESAPDVAVVPVECGWSDVGSFSALPTVVAPDGQGNVALGRHLLLDSTDCVVCSDSRHVVAAVGLDGVVVVHTDDATLVLPRARAQDVRAAVDAVTDQGWTELL